MVDHDRIQAAFSSRYWLFTRYELRNGEASLIELLKLELPQIDPDSWNERLAFGGVFLNGLPVYTDTPLPLPCKVEYYEPKFPLSEAKEQYSQFSPDWILWEDTDLLIAYKPDRLPSMAGKEQLSYNLKTYLENHLKKSLHFPSRLDMSTQGIIIISKQERMHGPLQALFEKRKITKEYLFQTAEKPGFDLLSVTAPIGKSAAHPVLREPFGKEAKAAETVLSVIAEAPLIPGDTTSKPTFFIRAQPKTGRTHQIRVHAAHSGVPIIGDNFYGGLNSKPLRLLSYSLSFIHPFTEEPFTFAIPLKTAPAWAYPALNALGSR